MEGERSLSGYQNTLSGDTGRIKGVRINPCKNALPHWLFSGLSKPISTSEHTITIYLYSIQ